MNLKNHKLVKEDKDAWHIQGPKDAKPFRVAKKGLSAEAHGRIAQHFADGGDVLPDTQDFLPGGSDVVAPQPSPSPGPTPGGDAWGLMHQSVADAGGAIAGVPGATPAPASPEQEASNYVTGVANVANRDAGKPLETATIKDGETDEVIPAPNASGVAANAAPAPTAPQLDLNKMGRGLMVGSGVDPNYAPTMQKGIQGEKDAARASADASAKQAAETYAAQQKTLADLSAYHQQTAAQFADIQKQQAAKRADIAASKIDPGQFWKKKGLGAKIGAALAAGLAGWGAAVNHQENPVTKILQTAVDEDIEAQKSNLNEKNNQLRELMEQGHSLQEAEQIYRSNKLSDLSGQVVALGSKYGGDQAAANAQKMNAELDQKSAGILQGVFAQKNAAAQQNAKTKLELLQLGLQQQQLAGQGDLTERARTGQLSPSEVHKLGKDAGSVLWTTEERPVVGRDGRPVMDSNGQPLTQQVHVSRLAADDKAAEKARPALEASENMAGKVRELERLVKEHPKGTWTAKDNQDAQSALNDIKLSWMKSQEGVAKLSDTELKMLDGMIADPSSFYGSASGKNNASINFLKKSVANSRKSILNAYTVPST